MIPAHSGDHPHSSRFLGSRLLEDSVDDVWLVGDFTGIAMGSEAVALSVTGLRMIIGI